MPLPADFYTANPVSFPELSAQFPSLAEVLKQNGQLDFSDPEAVRQLTKALAARDFGIKLELPEDRLCPGIENRFNYIIFAQQLIDCTVPSSFEEKIDGICPDRVLCLDIGTGASAIYPLLGCRQHEDWYFLATEIDSTSRTWATRNIVANHLTSRIRLVDADGSAGEILPSHQLLGLADYAVRMQITNPPFYASKQELLAAAQQKSRPPNSACTGAPVEMITPGGEVEFVTRIIGESAQPKNRTKVQWFSSMLGKLTSVSVIIARLQAVRCDNYAVTEFVQGQKTRRWCVAWSWAGWRPSLAVARGTGSIEKKLLPAPTEVAWEMQVGTDPGQPAVPRICQHLNHVISALDLSWRPTERPMGGTGSSQHGDVWSRKARRRRRAEPDAVMKDSGPDDHPGEADPEDEREPALMFEVEVRCARRNERGQPDPRGALIWVRWLQGHDAVMFESFCGWLKRQLRTQLAAEAAAEAEMKT